MGDCPTPGEQIEALASWIQHGGHRGVVDGLESIA
jgi:hypothetical protein